MLFKNMFNGQKGEERIKQLTELILEYENTEKENKKGITDEGNTHIRKDLKMNKKVPNIVIIGCFNDEFNFHIINCTPFVCEESAQKYKDEISSNLPASYQVVVLPFVRESQSEYTLQYPFGKE